MCQACIDALQERMDEAAAQTPPERLLVHLDNFDDPAMPHGETLTKDQVEAGLHESWNIHCWCRPIILEPHDVRSAVEIVADYIASDVGEVVT
jgi:hypothetical protein